MSKHNKLSNLFRYLIVLAIVVMALGLFGFSLPAKDRTDLYPQEFYSNTRSLLPDMDFTRVDALTFNPGENSLSSAVIDPGGGSTEFVSGVEAPETSVSIDIGSVRLSDRHFATLPPTAGEIDTADAVALRCDSEGAPRIAALAMILDISPLLTLPV